MPFLGWWKKRDPNSKARAWWPPTFGDKVWSRLESPGGSWCRPDEHFSRCRWIFFLWSKATKVKPVALLAPFPSYSLENWGWKTSQLCEDYLKKTWNQKLEVDLFRGFFSGFQVFWWIFEVNFFALQTPWRGGWWWMYLILMAILVKNYPTKNNRKFYTGTKLYLEILHRKCFNKKVPIGTKHIVTYSGFFLEDIFVKFWWLRFIPDYCWIERWN